jgi:hypothetical protein
VVNLFGQTIYSENIEGLSSTMLNTSEYANGVYFIKVDTNKGSGIQKVIVSH